MRLTPSYASSTRCSPTRNTIHVPTSHAHVLGSVGRKQVQLHQQHPFAHFWNDRYVLRPPQWLPPYPISPYTH